MHQKLPPPPPVRSGSPLIYIPGTEWILVFEGRTRGGKNWGGAWDGTLLLHFLLSHFSKIGKFFLAMPLVSELEYGKLVSILTPRQTRPNISRDPFLEDKKRLSFN